MHSLMNLSRVELGFPTERLLTFFLPVPPTRLEGADRIRLFHRQLHERIQALPGVQSVAISTGAPLQGGFGMAFNIVGRPVAQGAQRDGARFVMATPDYFRTFGLQIQRGRAFTESDSEASPRVALVNEAFVMRHLAGVDPLAQRVAVDELIPGQARLGQAGRVADHRSRPRRPQRRAAQRDAAGDRRAVRPEPVAVGRGDGALGGRSEPAPQQHRRRRPADGPRPADVRSAHDGAGGPRVDDQRPLQRPAVRRLRGRGPAARGDRDLRRHVVRRGAAQPRAGAAHGARRRARPGGAARDAGRDEDRAPRHPARLRRGLWGRPCHAGHVVRREPARPRPLRRDRARPGRDGAPGLLRPGAPRGERSTRWWRFGSTSARVGDSSRRCAG